MASSLVALVHIPFMTDPLIRDNDSGVFRHETESKQNRHTRDNIPDAAYSLIIVQAQEHGMFREIRRPQGLGHRDDGVKRFQRWKEID